MSTTEKFILTCFVVIYTVVVGKIVLQWAAKLLFGKEIEKQNVQKAHK